MKDINNVMEQNRKEYEKNLREIGRKRVEIKVINKVYRYDSIAQACLQELKGDITKLEKENKSLRWRLGL